MESIDGQHTGSWVKRARELALRVGIYFLLRKSEYLPKQSGTCNGLKWSDVIFFDKQGFPIRCTLIKKGQASSVKTVIPFSKCDQFGKGRNILHVRQSDGERCIVQDLEEWAIETREKLGADTNDYLFKVKDKVLISSEQVTAVMKATAEFCGFNSKKVSAHSLRYGGATMLAAAGLPQYIIAYFGGWCEDSNSLQLYTQLNVSSNATVSSIFSQGDKAPLHEARIRDVGHRREENAAGRRAQAR
jgi:Phage integrase family